MPRPTIPALLASLLFCSIARAESTQPAAAEPVVTIDSKIKHQTIIGWGGTAPGERLHLPEFLRNEIFQALVDDLGLTRLRWEPPRHEWEYPFNDNDDPNKINWPAFKTDQTDAAAKEWILPFKQRVEARGEPFNLYLSPSFFRSGSTGPAPDWMMRPDEYAEWATSFLLHIKKAHGLEPDYYSICNEAGNHNDFTPQVMAAMIKALAPRLKTEGLKTAIEFPECVSADQSWNYIENTKDDAELWRSVGIVTYHLYGGTKHRRDLRDFALARKIPTGQTECLGGTIRQLFDDLTEADASVWEQYALAGPWPGNAAYLYTPLSNGSIQPAGEYWNFRQVMHYVRPGAVRIDAISDSDSVRALAFVKDSKTTVVLLSNPGRASGVVTIKGLPEGKYSSSSSALGRAYRELGIRRVADDNILHVILEHDSVLTVAPYADVNQPPIVTHLQAKPDFLTLPKSAALLTAAAVDVEGDPLTYAWEIIKQPAGGKATLEKPHESVSAVNMLTVPGEYIFAVTASDGQTKTTRQLMLSVFDKNQPPRIMEVHNRLPVLVVLPKSETELRVAALDLEGDKLSYKWSLVTQPAGAQANLDTPAAANCKAAGLTVAGDYVFKIQISDGQNTVEETLPVTVYPKDRFQWPGTK